jgi:uncharacterized protein YbaA (DUF1428 family)
MSYVDGFVFVVPKKNLAKYKKMATEASKVWKKFGALDYKECMGDDLYPDSQGMEVLPFPKLVKAKSGETVWFSFITYKSRKDRDQVNKKVMKYFTDKYGEDMDMTMPFDMKRFSHGGFKTIVEA